MNEELVQRHFQTNNYLNGLILLMHEGTGYELNGTQLKSPFQFA